jgi:hypothetical protein
MSEQDSREFGKGFGDAVAPSFQKMAEGWSGGFELAYTAKAFRRMNGRWPKDYTELSAFVQQSQGFLELEEYDRVDFTQLPDDKLEVAFLSPGKTNRVSFTLEAPPLR